MADKSNTFGMVLHWGIVINSSLGAKHSCSACRLKDQVPKILLWEG